MLGNTGYRFNHQLYKIGKAINIKFKLQELLRYFPNSKLVLLLCTPYYSVLEKKFHRFFSEFQFRGFFRYSYLIGRTELFILRRKQILEIINRDGDSYLLKHGNYEIIY